MKRKLDQLRARIEELKGSDIIDRETLNQVGCVIDIAELSEGFLNCGFDDADCYLAVLKARLRSETEKLRSL